MRYDVDAADDDFDEYDFMMRMIMPLEKNERRNSGCMLRHKETKKALRLKTS